MTEATQPRVARGTMLTAGTLATALIALLAFAPLASAATDPVASGSTTLTINSGLYNKLKKAGVKIQRVSPAKLKGKKATFTVTGGEMDPTTGVGTLTLGGGLKFKAGKKTAAIKSLSVDTTKKSLNGKVAGKKMKLASIKSFTATRNGFGVNVRLKTLKLTGSAAKQLNKKLGFSGKGKESQGRASVSKVVQPPFKANQVLGTGSSEAQPSTLMVLPTGNMTFATNTTTLGKLLAAEVKVNPISPTTVPSLGTFSFPISGGTIAPDATAGVVQSAGGLKLEQELKFLAEAFPPLVTKITLGAFYVDLAAKTVSVEVVAESNAEVEGKKPLNLGNLGRSSIADITLTGATVVADPVNRTVSVQNAPATLQPVSTEVLNGFISVYEGYKKALGTPETKEKLKAGDPLGTFSFTAQTE